MEGGSTSCAILIIPDSFSRLLLVSLFPIVTTVLMDDQNVDNQPREVWKTFSLTHVEYIENDQVTNDRDDGAELFMANYRLEKSWQFSASRLSSLLSCLLRHSFYEETFTL